MNKRNRNTGQKEFTENSAHYPVTPVSADDPPLFTIPDVAIVLSVEDARHLGQYQIAGLDSPTYGPLHIPSLLLPTGNASASPAYELLYFNNVVPCAADTLELSFALRGVPYTAELSKIPVELGQGKTGYNGSLLDLESAKVNAAVLGPHAFLPPGTSGPVPQKKGDSSSSPKTNIPVCTAS